MGKRLSLISPASPAVITITTTTTIIITIIIILIMDRPASAAVVAMLFSLVSSTSIVEASVLSHKPLRPWGASLLKTDGLKLSCDVCSNVTAPCQYSRAYPDSSLKLSGMPAWIRNLEASTGFRASRCQASEIRTAQNLLTLRVFSFRAGLAFRSTI